MKRHLDAQETNEPQWQGFPFSAPVSDPEEDIPGTEPKKMKAKKKSAKTSSDRVCGGMFGGFVKTNSGKGGKKKDSTKEIRIKSDETNQPLVPPFIEQQQLDLSSEEELCQNTVWYGHTQKFKRSSSVSPIEEEFNIDTNHKQQNNWLAIALSPGEQLCCVGSSNIKCLKGRVEILGLILDGNDAVKNDGRGSSISIHAPGWFGAVIIKALSNNLNTINVENKKGLSPIIDPNSEYPIHLLIESIPFARDVPCLFTAITDGNEGNRQQQFSSMSTSNLICLENERKLKQHNEGDNDFVHISDLAIHGWCIIHKASKVAPATSVINISDRWKQAADDMVWNHLHQLNHLYHSKKEKKTIDNKQDKNYFNPPRIMVCGSKGVGKSSFVRYVLHRMISARRDWLRENLVYTSFEGSPQLWRSTGVSYLDYDVGQPECTPPGMLSLHFLSGELSSSSSCLSSFSSSSSSSSLLPKNDNTSTLLLGPPYTHMHPTCGEAAIFFGDSTPRRDPTRYLANASQLMKFHINQFDQNLNQRLLDHQTNNDNECVVVVKDDNDGTEKQHQQLQYDNDNNDQNDDDELLFRLKILNQSCPLVVNCDGWVNGLGYELLGQLIKLVSPTDMIQILGHGNKYFNLPSNENQTNLKKKKNNVLFLPDEKKNMNFENLQEKTETNDIGNNISDIDNNIEYIGNDDSSSSVSSEHWYPSKIFRESDDYHVGRKEDTVGISTGLEWMQGAQFGQQASSSSQNCGKLHVLGAWDLNGEVPPDPKFKYLAKLDLTLPSPPPPPPPTPSSSSLLPVVVSPSDLRSIRVATYFAKCLNETKKTLSPMKNHLNNLNQQYGDNIVNTSIRNGSLADPNCSLAKALAACPPYRIHLSQINICEIDDMMFLPRSLRYVHHRTQSPPCSSSFSVNINSDDLRAKELMKTEMSEMFHGLNGSIVALLTSGSQSSTTHGVFNQPNSNNICNFDNCIGYGIVRSIDVEKEFLYLLTPVPYLLLQKKVRTLLRSPPAGDRGLSLPIQLLYGGEGHVSPYLFGESISNPSAGMMKSRNNLQRGGGGGGK